MTRPDEMIATDDHPKGNYYAQLEDGRILSVDDGAFRTSEDGGLTWSEPSERRDSDGGPVGQTAMSLLSLSGNKVGLLTNPRPPGDGHVLFWRSEDGGETWSAPVRATPPGTSTYVVSTDVVMRTSSGRIIVPCYVALGKERDAADRLPTMWGKLINGQWAPVSGHYSDPRFTAVYVAYSDDEGRTWRRNEDGELLIVLDWSAIIHLRQRGERRRSGARPPADDAAHGTRDASTRPGRSDDGTTWSRPEPTSLAASTTPAYVASLPHPGHLLCVWNQHSEEEIKRGYTRSRLSAAVSRNGGSVWEFFQNVESWHEETRVEPGPDPARPSGRVRLRAGHAGGGAGDGAHSLPITADSPWDWRITYPRVNVMGDRVFVQYGYSRYSEHETRAEHLVETGQRLKILPITWFYGGKEPADNPFLPSSSFVLSGSREAFTSPRPSPVKREGKITLTPALSR